MRIAVALGTLAVCIALPGAAALAETIEAPVGGRAIPLGPERVACPEAGRHDWGVISGGHALVPPAGDDAVGKVTTMRVAPDAAHCASASPSDAITLVAMARFPVVDAASITFEADAGRVTLKGRGLRGLALRWRSGETSGLDACSETTTGTGPSPSETCALAVAQGLPADPSQLALELLPSGGRFGADVQPFDADGRKLGPADYTWHPARAVLSELVQPDAAVDVHAGVASVTLVHPEAIGAVDCEDASCDLEGKELVIRNEHGPNDVLEAHFHLRPHVYLARASSVVDANPTLAIPLQRCPVALASPPPLRGLADQLVVVRVGGRCARDPSLEFFAGTAAAPVEKTERVGDDLFAALRIGRLDSSELAVTVERAHTVVGGARIGTRGRSSSTARIELGEYGAIDFIPTNREARVLVAAGAQDRQLALVPVPGVYDVRRDPSGADFIRGVEGAAGSVALHLAYRDRTLPPSLRTLDLGEIVEPLDRTLKAANIPVALGASALAAAPLIELACGDGTGHAVHIRPATTTAIPYAARETCRLVLHGERLRREEGAQALVLGIVVTASDGSPRNDARVEQRVLLRPAAQPRYIYVSGVAAPFDRVTVRASLATDDPHYAVAPDEKLGADVQWSVVMGTDHFRIYATTAIPTGLFRVADKDHSGILTFNAGALARLVALTRDGQEWPLGLEAGVVWVGIAGDTAAAGAHGEVAIVAGLGISVPIANPSRSTQTSINLHAWFEYEASRDFMSSAGSPFGFVFGPSISVGDVGANF